MNSLTQAAAIWFVLLCLLFVFYPILAEAIWFFYIFIHWGFALAGGIILVAALVRGLRKRMAWLPALILAGVGLTLFFTSGFRLGRLAFFQIRKGHYEELLAEAVRTGEIPGQAGDIDEGPPVRYAFYWLRGVTDNWVGVVYDPTGAVIRANQIPDMEHLHAPEWIDVVRLFGGDLYRCETLQGDWYLCWFT